MPIVRMESFELEVSDRFTVDEERDARLSLVSTNPVLLVRCAVLKPHPEANGGRGALLAVSSAGGRHIDAGGRVLTVFRHGSRAHGMLLEDEHGLERISVLAVQRGRNVLLVQSRTPTHLAGASEQLVTELVSPLAVMGTEPDGENT